MKKKNNNSLGDRIKAAKSADEVLCLLAEGRTFEYAAPKTQRRWKRFADRRLAALTAPTPTTTAPTKNIKKKG